MKICGWYRKCLFPYSENEKQNESTKCEDSKNERENAKEMTLSGTFSHLNFNKPSCQCFGLALLCSAWIWTIHIVLIRYVCHPSCVRCVHFFSLVTIVTTYFSVAFLPYERKSVIYEFVCVNVTLSFVAKDIRRMQKGCHRFASRPLLKACKRVCVS